MTLLALACLSAAVGCRRKPPRIELSAVERCEAGIDRALHQSTSAGRDRIYYESCADVYAEAPCRDAVRGAASVPNDVRLVAIGEPCRKAYCPLLDERGELEACGASFQSSADGLQRSWPDLHNAILKHDARGYAPRLTRQMLGFYMRVLTWPKDGPAGDASAAPPAPSAQR